MIGLVSTSAPVMQKSLIFCRIGHHSIRGAARRPELPVMNTCGLRAESAYGGGIQSMRIDERMNITLVPGGN